MCDPAKGQIGFTKNATQWLVASRDPTRRSEAGDVERRRAEGQGDDGPPKPAAVAKERDRTPALPCWLAHAGHSTPAKAGAGRRPAR